MPKNKLIITDGYSRVVMGSKRQRGRRVDGIILDRSWWEMYSTVNRKRDKARLFRAIIDPHSDQVVVLPPDEMAHLSEARYIGDEWKKELAFRRLKNTPRVPALNPPV